MKRLLAMLSVGVLAAVGLAAVAAAGAAGFARVSALPGSGELSITNAQANAVWRPCVLSVICTNLEARTVTVYRVSGALEYPVGRSTATAQSYVYEFPANYWCGVSNGVKVTVSPPCTGTVEVICE